MRLRDAVTGETLAAAGTVAAFTATVGAVVAATVLGFVVEQPGELLDRGSWWLAGVAVGWWGRWTWLSLAAVGATAARQPGRHRIELVADVRRVTWALVKLAAGWTLWVRAIRWLQRRAGSRWWSRWLARAARGAVAVNTIVVVPALLAADDVGQIAPVARAARRRMAGGRFRLGAVLAGIFTAAVLAAVGVLAVAVYLSPPSWATALLGVVATVVLAGSAVVSGTVVQASWARTGAAW